VRIKLVKFNEVNDKIIAEYSTNQSIYWILDEFENDNSVTISKIYRFNKTDIYYEGMEIDDFEEIESDFDSILFIFASRIEDYFKIDKHKLDIEIDIYFHKEIKFNSKLFRAERDISIFRKINKIIHENIYIGSDDKANLPFNEFLVLLQNFPNSYELSKYANARIFTIIDEHFTQIDDAKDNYEKYLNKKISRTGENLLSTFKEYEIEKYNVILRKLEIMLKDEETYTEKQWQKEINQIILLLYPKYITVFEEAPVKDDVKKTTRSIDFILIDSNGHIDIMFPAS
jgi:hypothetical protein